MTNYIYVVQGETGKYGDNITWLVCAFSRKVSADQYVAELRSEVDIALVTALSKDKLYDLDHNYQLIDGYIKYSVVKVPKYDQDSDY